MATGSSPDSLATIKDSGVRSGRGGGSSSSVWGRMFSEDVLPVLGSAAWWDAGWSSGEVGTVQGGPCASCPTDGSADGGSSGESEEK